MNRELDTAEVIGLLALDHERIHQQLEDFQNIAHADDWEHADRVFRRLEVLIERHMYFEEHDVFPLFEQHMSLSPCVGGIQTMRQQHLAIRDALEEAGLGLQLHHLREQSVVALSESVLAHTRDEDDWARAMAECMRKSPAEAHTTLDRLRDLVAARILRSAAR
jgi:hypothetical protein